METFIEVCCSFLELIDSLWVFFFTPLVDLPDYVFSKLGFSGTVSNVIGGIISALLKLFPVLSNTPLLFILLGSGLLFLLLWRFVNSLTGLFS